MMTTVGYARVSTDGQTVDGQVDELRRAGARTIFRADAPRTACNDCTPAFE